MPSMTGTEFSTPVDYSTKDETNTSTSITRILTSPRMWYTGAPAAVALFCGHIYQHALNNQKKDAFYDGSDSGVASDDKALLKPDFMSPAVCTKAVLVKG